MNETDIKKCIKNGYCWLAYEECEEPVKCLIRELNTGWERSGELHATKHEAQAALDKAKVNSDHIQDSLSWLGAEEEKVSFHNRALKYAENLHKLNQAGTPQYYRIPFGSHDILCLTKDLPHPLASAIEYLYRAGRKPGNDAARDVHKAINMCTRWLEGGAK